MKEWIEVTSDQDRMKGISRYTLAWYVYDLTEELMIPDGIEPEDL